MVIDIAVTAADITNPRFSDNILYKLSYFSGLMMNDSLRRSGYDIGNSEKLFQGAKDFGIFLSNDQVNKFLAHNLMISDRNHQMNLTRVTSWDDAQTLHILDSLSVYAVVNIPHQADYQILDVGTGAGFPGIPLSIMLPKVQFTLLEARRKKVDFLKSVITKLDLKNVDLIYGRAEDVAHQESVRATFDLVTSRAVAPLNTLIELTVPFLKLDGLLAVQKSEKIHRELTESKNAIQTFGLNFESLHFFQQFKLMPPGRVILVMRKMKLPPDEFPRRPGIPSKKPL